MKFGKIASLLFGISTPLMLASSTESVTVSNAAMPHAKTLLNNKQKKARKKNKMAKQSRKKNR